MNSTAFSTIISVIISTTTIVVFNYINQRRDSKKELNNELNSLLDIVIKYPYLEDKAFVNKWDNYKNSSLEPYLRYDAYCTRLFNFLNRVCIHFKYDKRKIENFIAIKDWIRLHKDYWEKPQELFENIDSYDLKFRNMINQYLKN